MGSLKPGMFRRLTIAAVLVVIDYTARHIFNRGKLGRVTTIHFARWVFLDGGRRVLFLSNYDGSLESYMDDFINKVGFGLNVVFSNGIGYPRTNWLLCDGCKDEVDDPHCRPTADLEGHGPFGFRDGISQPEIDWEQQYGPLGAHADYGNR